METLEKNKNGTVNTGETNQKNDTQISQKRRGKRLPEKEFRVRPSILTEMLKRPEIQAAHNMAFALALHLVIFGIISDLIKHGSVDLGFTNIINLFGKPVLSLKILMGLHLTPILIMYPVFRLWAFLRIRSSSLNLKSVLDYSYYSILVVIFIMYYVIPCQIHFFGESGRIPPAFSAFVVMEQLRLTMKMYAFLRTNTPRVLQYTGKKTSEKKLPKRKESNSNLVESKNDSPSHTNTNVRRRKQDSVSENKQEANSSQSLEKEAQNDETRFQYFDDVPFPNIGNLLYFLYAPTLVYRDNYPRSSSRDWSFIFWHVMHLLGSIVFYNLMHHRFGFVLLQNFGPNHPMTVNDLVNTLLCHVALGMFGSLIAWAIILHSTQNIFAELLRFGDRLFYKEWWSCTSMSEYHRMWNSPVQDFLYNYVYKEAWDLGLGKKIKWLPALFVFSISNFFHEYAMSFVCQFFCPIMGIMFGGPGTFLTFLPNKKFPKLGNIFIHWSMSLGHAIMHTFYVMEHFSRVNNCPPAETPFLDFVIPRFLTCDAIKWN